MYRKDLIPILLDQPMTVVELGRELGISPREVAENLHHLMRSLAHSGYIAIVTPARCRKCDFTFEERKLKKPGRCPKCRETWIEPPRIEIRRTAGSGGSGPARQGTRED